jgi:hypothetical protein
MITAHTFALLLAALCFLIAAKPPGAPALRWEWLGAAFVVCAWLL